MARYRVQGPDGAVHVFEGPDGASPAEVSAVASQQFGARPTAGQDLTPTTPRKLAPADDPGLLGSVAIGAGRTVDNIIDGFAQMVLAHGSTDSALKALKDAHEEKSRLYAPLQETHPVGTAVGEAAPSMIIPAGGAATALGTVGRLAAAGAVPGLLEYGAPEDRLKHAAAGAAANAVGGVVIPKLASAVVNAVPALGRVARAVIDPLRQSGRADIAGRTLNAAAGDDAAGAAARLASAQPLVPGSLPTAGQVAENGGIAALERSVSQAQPAEFAARGMDQAAARTAALRSIAQDAPAMKAAEAARKADSDPLYQSVLSQVVPVTAPLKSLLDRPSMQSALARAQKIAEEDGRTFGLSGGTQTPASAILNASGAPMVPSVAVPAQISGQTLQDIKMGMDALLSDPASGIAKVEANGIKETRGQLLKFMESTLPKFKDARTTYAGMSKPINQMQIGSDLMDKLAPALSDYGALGRETAAKYAQALRNAPALAKNATKFPGATLEDIMTPQQMDLINNVARDLARKSNAQDLGRGVGSDTFQKLSMSNLAERSGAPGVVNAALNMPGVNKLAKFAYSGPDEQIQSEIARALLDPQTAAALMGRSGAVLQPAIPFKQILTSAPSKATQIGGTAAGQTVANLFAQ